MFDINFSIICLPLILNCKLKISKNSYLYIEYCST